MATTPAPEPNTGGSETAGTPTELRTRYLGVELDNPLVASPSPLTRDPEMLDRLQDAGVGAVVLPSLFEEEIEHEMASFGAGAAPGGWAGGAAVGAEGFGGYFDALDQGVGSGPEDHLGSVRRAVERLRVPVIASLNGTSPGGWTHYAKALADTGVAAIECNIYLVAADTSVSGTEVEDRYLQVVSAIAGAVDVPVSVKLGPYFSSPGHLARRVVDAGARGLVLFNRFYQPDIDLDTLTVSPNLVLSDPHELRLVLRWMAILRGRVAADLAATTGVHEATDAVKLLLAGADVVMMASALLRHGPEHVATVLAGMAQWFGERDYVSVDQARGSLSQESVPDPEAFERANYMATLRSYGTGTGPLRSGAGT